MVAVVMMLVYCGVVVIVFLVYCGVCSCSAVNVL